MVNVISTVFSFNGAGVALILRRSRPAAAQMLARTQLVVGLPDVDGHTRSGRIGLLCHIHKLSAFSVGVRELPSTKLPLMPFVDLTLRPQPVGQIMTMLAAALMPQLLGALCNLFFQTHVFVHAQNGSGIFMNGFLFHKSPFTCIDFSQKSASSTMR
jgi:hypothetical protein